MEEVAVGGAVHQWAGMQAAGVIKKVTGGASPGV
jgi:hypothetical protein